MDEFTNFGMIPAIAQKLSIIRHGNIPVLIGVQDFVQLQQVYGKEDALLIRSQPGTKVFFRPRTIDVAKSISELAGMTTVYERKVSSNGQITEKESGKALIDPAEVLAMDDEVIFVTTPRTPPMLLPRFTWKAHEDATRFPPVSKQEVVIDERLVRDELNSPPVAEEPPAPRPKPRQRKVVQDAPPAEQIKPEEAPPAPEPPKTEVPELEYKAPPAKTESADDDDDEFGPGAI